MSKIFSDEFASTSSIDVKSDVLNHLKMLSLDDFLSMVDFSNALPKVLNITLRSNFEIYRVIVDLLNVAGYKSPIWEPLPPKLYNWRTIDRKVLVKYGRRIIEQIRDGIDVSRCVLDIDGFRFFYKPAHSVDRIVSGRVYTLDFDYDILPTRVHKSSRAFVPYENLQYSIDKFFERSELSNKVLLIK